MKRLSRIEHRKLNHAHAEGVFDRWQQFCRKMDRRKLRYTASKLIAEGLEVIHKAMRLVYHDWDNVGVPYSVWYEEEATVIEDDWGDEDGVYGSRVSCFESSFFSDDLNDFDDFDDDDFGDERDDRGLDYDDDYDFNRNYDYGFPHEYY